MKTLPTRRTYNLYRKVTMAIILFCLFLSLSGTLLAGNILDKTGNPTATPLVAFSLRQLSSAYTGKAIQVRRSSDNTTQAIGFTAAGDLDTVALKTFVGSGTGYVSIWYDQSGNSYNATQTTAANQPTIMIGGVISRDNGQPSLYTNGPTGYLSYGPVTQLVGNTQVTRMEVARSRSSSFGITEGLGLYQLDLQLFPAQVMVQFETNNITASGAVASTTTLMSINSVRNNGASQVYINTALLGTTAAALQTFLSPVTGYIGIRFDYYQGNYGPGAFSETILFNSVLSDADRQAINYNENWYYSLGFDPCSITQASLSPNATTTKALYACTQDGPWAYYYDPAHPLKLLFGLAKDPGSTGANPTFVVDSSNLTTTADPTTIYYSATSGAEGIFALGRYWNVYTRSTLASPVNVRFFYNPADTVAARNAALAFKASTGASMMSNLLWFKTVGGPFAPDSLTATPTANVKGSRIILTPVYGSKDGVNYAEFDGITSFSGGTGIYIVSNTLVILPVIIGSFTGRLVNGMTVLSWTTESESNSGRFEIERSNDGSAWIKIGQVAAAGNSSTALSYQFTDTVPIQGGNSLYYRLRLVDKDGGYTYSGVVLVKLYDNVMVVPQLSRVGPNPFGGEIEITCTVAGSGPVEVLLRDMAGVVLIHRKYTANKGDNVWRLTNLTGLAQGIYIVQVLQGGMEGISKVIKL
ncbi:MAG TPA: arabinofuranosidase catalytic domain-containing protein [Puia sp.]|nr:arabinofuranosidase catalytic domain-containing protein [Puia sp.]